MDGRATGFTGGLFPEGSNLPPETHREAGLAAAAQIQPLDADGNLDPEIGKIGMISIGMSNTQMEFSQFISRNSQTLSLNPNLVLVNGALGGQTAERWVDPQGLPWRELSGRLNKAGLSPLQVQVAWVKQTLTRGGDFPEKAEELQGYLESIARNLKLHFPNLRIAYYSSRTRSYTYLRGLSPEPQAFETGFSVKWMIEKQIEGDPTLNFDPLAGEVNAPYLTWGPYLWIDGEQAREDGRVWLPEDLAKDCTHPSNSGKEKVADMLLEFFSTEETAVGWFLAENPSERTEALSATTVPVEIVPATEQEPLTPFPTSTFFRPTLSPEETQVAAPKATLAGAQLQGEEAPEPFTSPVMVVVAILMLGIILIAGWGLRTPR